MSTHASSVVFCTAPLPEISCAEPHDGHKHSTCNLLSPAAGAATFSLNRPRTRLRLAPFASISSQHAHALPSSPCLISTEDSARLQGLPGIKPQYQQPFGWIAASPQQEGELGGEEGISAGEDEDEDEEEGGGSGESSGEGLGSEIEELMSIKCSACHKALIQPPGRGQSANAEVDIKLCDGCHRGYHGSCARRRGMGTIVKLGAGGRLSTRRFWYCCSGCKMSHQRLLERCQEGLESVPEGIAAPLRQHLAMLTRDSGLSMGNSSRGLTWSLVDCGEADRRPLSVQGSRMDDVVLLLSQQYGPFVVKQVEGTDYGVLLRQGELPLGAATMDCFGQDACSVDLMASTDQLRASPGDASAAADLDAILEADERGVKGKAASAPASLGTKPLDRGVARALVGCLESYLGPSRAASKLLGIVDDPLSVEGGAAMDLWKQLGYKRMTNRQVHHLQATYPLLGANADRAIIFAKDLQAPAGQPKSTRALSSNVSAGRAGEGVGYSSSTTQDAAESRGQEQQQQQQQQQQTQTRPRRRFNLSMKLWGWAGRQLVHAATFGLV